MKRTLWILVFFLLPGVLATAQNTLTPQNLFDIASVMEVAISPDKNYIAYTLNVPRPFTDDAGGDYRELYVYNVQTGESTPLLTGSNSVFSIGWTPDGDAISFRANLPGVAGVQVYSIDRVAGEPYALTRQTGGVNSYQFIDAGTLAIVSISPEDPVRGELREKGFNIDVFEEEYRHLNLYRYDINTHQTRQLTDGVAVFDFVLSPDKRMAAAAIAPRNLVDDSYMFKRIFTVNMQTGEMKLLVNNPGKLGKMVWSPDGTKLAFQSASKLEDAVVGSLFVADVPNEKSFEELRNYVHGMELSVIDHTWQDNRTLLYAAEEGVDIVLSEQRLDRTEREIMIPPAQVVFGRFHHVDGMIALSGNTWQHPSELFTFDIRRKQLTRLTHHNEWLADIQLSHQRKLVYNARDGKDIQGVLLYPLNYEQGKSYPLIT